MEGPASEGEVSINNNFAPFPPLQSSCKYLFKSHLYVRLASNRCVALCEGDVLFNSQEKVNKLEKLLMNFDNKF